MTIKKILVLEDDEIVAEIVTEILSIEGYDVDCSESGEKAFALYENAFLSGRPYDAVLLDLTIKEGMGGHATMQKLIELDSNVKGIVTSGFVNDPIIKYYSNYGFKAAICKPYMSRELLETIEKTLQSD